MPATAGDTCQARLVISDNASSGSEVALLAMSLISGLCQRLILSRDRQVWDREAAAAVPAAFGHNEQAGVVLPD